MPDLKPGEYVGGDGRIITWRKNTSFNGWYPAGGFAISDPDVPAAIAALQAAYDEAHKAPWVEWSRDIWHYRIREDGTEPQVHCGVSTWSGESSGSSWVIGFRAGLVQGRKEGKK